MIFFTQLINEELENNKLSLPFGITVKEILDLLIANPIEEELELLILSELYKYTKLGKTLISIDPRGSDILKHGALYSIKKALENGTIEKSLYGINYIELN